MTVLHHVELLCTISFLFLHPFVQIAKRLLNSVDESICIHHRIIAVTMLVYIYSECDTSSSSMLLSFTCLFSHYTKSKFPSHGNLKIFLTESYSWQHTASFLSMYEFKMIEGCYAEQNSLKRMKLDWHKKLINSYYHNQIIFILFVTIITIMMCITINLTSMLLLDFTASTDIYRYSSLIYNWINFTSPNSSSPLIF